MPAPQLGESAFGEEEPEDDEDGDEECGDEAEDDGIEEALGHGAGIEVDGVLGVEGDGFDLALNLGGGGGAALFEFFKFGEVVIFAGDERGFSGGDFFEIGEHFLGGLVAHFAFFGHGDFDDFADACAEFGDDMIGRDEVFFEVFVHDGGGGGGVKGDASGDHVVEGGAEGIEVGALVDVELAADLFGGDVIGCAVGFARLGFGLGGFDIGGFTGETHVGEFGDSFGGDHDVFGFDVAVDKTGLVGVDEGFGDLDGEGESLFFGITLAFFEFIVDGVAFDVLHDKIVASIGLTDVHGTDDVGVIQFGRGAAFLVKAFDEFGVIAGAVGEDFDGDDAVEGELFSLVNGGHGTGTEAGKDLITGDLLVITLLFGHGSHPFNLTSCDDAIFHEDVGKASLVLFFGKLGLDGDAIIDFGPGGEPLVDNELAEDGVLFIGHAKGHKVSTLIRTSWM